MHEDNRLFYRLLNSAHILEGESNVKDAIGMVTNKQSNRFFSLVQILFAQQKDTDLPFARKPVSGWVICLVYIDSMWRVQF